MTSGALKKLRNAAKIQVLVGKKSDDCHCVNTNVNFCIDTEVF